MPFPGDGQGKTCTKPAPRTPSASPPPAPCTALFLCSAARFRAGRGRFFSAIFPPPTLRRMRQGGASPHHPAFSPPAPPRFPAFFLVQPPAERFCMAAPHVFPLRRSVPARFPPRGGEYLTVPVGRQEVIVPPTRGGEKPCADMRGGSRSRPSCAPCGEGLCLLPLTQRVLCRQKAF